MTCQQFNSFATNFLLPSKKLSKESVIVASAILPRDTRIMTVLVGMVVFKEFPKVPWPVARKGCKEDVAKIRQWARPYGDSTRQLIVRGKSTKENPGTLPISAYGRRKLPNNPASLEDLTERLEEESVTADVNEENVEREESIALVANKHDVILIAKFKEISEPLF